MSSGDIWEGAGRSRWRRLLVDSAGAALVALLAVLVQLGQGGWLWVVIALLVLALAVRNVNRTTAVVCAVLGALIQLGSGELAPVADLVYFPLYFVLGMDRRRWVRRAGLVAIAVAVLLGGIGATLLLSGQGRVGLEPVTVLALAMSSAVVCGGGWIAGYLRFQNRRVVQSRIDAQLEAVERLRLTEALDQQQERARIAADMHDVVAHSWAVVAAQSDGARYSLQTSPHETERALGVIGETARSAIADLRTILHELRYSEATGSTPGHNQQDQLLERMQASGMTLDLQERGERSNSPLLALTAYRLLSESLTNALKHGDLSRPVFIEQDWRDGYRLVVSNTVDPDAAPGDGARHGIIGMTERAAVAGGRVTIERPAGTHRVIARIPSPQVPPPQKAPR